MTKGWTALLAGAGLVGAQQVSQAVPAARPAEAPSAKPAVPPVDLSVLHVQVILDHLGFAPGVLDGRPGLSLVNAVKGFQESRGLPETGEVDARTLQALRRYRALRPVRTITVTPDMVAGPFFNPIPHDPVEQAKLPALGYRTPLEKVAEMFHTTPLALIALNGPGTRLTPGTRVVFPNALPGSRAYDSKLPEGWRATLSGLNVDANQPHGDRVVVDKSQGVLRVLDGDRLVAQFTATMGSEHDPLPIGRWKILGPSYNPPFRYNAALFWDAGDKSAKASLPPGPNGPVGVVWLDLSKPHYGIHGTPSPETIGRAESHGCIRLTNWDAARLALMVKAGTPAVFQP